MSLAVDSLQETSEPALADFHGFGNRQEILETVETYNVIYMTRDAELQDSKKEIIETHGNRGNRGRVLMSLSQCACHERPGQWARAYVSLSQCRRHERSGQWVS